jgi:hypothetical protein
MPDSDVLNRLFGELAGTDLPVPAPASVVARGTQRRRRARGRAAIVVAAVAAVAVGITQFPRIDQGASAILSQRTRPAICTAAPDAQLSTELGRVLPVSQQQSVSVVALSPNHKVMYLMTTTGGYHGVAAESVATGAISEKITTQPPNWNGAEGGLGPHGEVVFTMTDSYDGSFAATEVVVWSPTSLPSWMPTRSFGQVVPLGGSDALSAPVFAGPDHQLVAWESSGDGSVVDSSDSPARQIVEVDLLTGAIEVVATGYVGAPVFVGSDLVWPVASSATGPTHLVAVSASAIPARQRVAVPLPLRNAGAATAIASSGGATLYASAGLTKLFYSPSPSQPARQVLQLPAGNYLVPGGLAVGPGYLAWNTSAAASFVASAKSLAAARITDGSTSWGAVQGLGSDVLASRSAHPKSGPTSLYLLSGSVIERLTCA